jgi:hypothetical protein
MASSARGGEQALSPSIASPTSPTRPATATRPAPAGLPVRADVAASPPTG